MTRYGSAGTVALVTVLALGGTPALGAGQTGTSSGGTCGGSSTQMGQRTLATDDWLFRFVVEMVVEDVVQNGGTVQDVLNAIDEVTTWWESYQSGTQTGGGTQSGGQTTGGTQGGSGSGTSGTQSQGGTSGATPARRAGTRGG